MNFDLKDIERMTPEQQKQFSELLNKAHPSIPSKMDTSRTLNTPSIQELTKGKVDDNEIDFSEPPPPLPPSGAEPIKIPTIQVDKETSFLQQDRILKRQSDDEAEKNLKEEVEQKIKDRVEQARQPDPILNFNPSGKIHPIRAKLRASMGMNPAGGFSKPYKVEIGGVSYELRALNREEATLATTMAIMLSENDAQFRGAMEECVVGFSVRSIDGTELPEIFDVAKEMPDDAGNAVKLAEHKRRELAAYAFIDELRSAPTELTTTLMVYYNQEFPPVELLGKDKEFLQCPDGDCPHKRIVEKETEGNAKKYFCPNHGSELARENALPNPF